MRAYLDRMNTSQRRNIEGNERDANKEQSYQEIKREAGTGPRRIGKRIELGEDLYSMFFASMLHPDYVHFHVRVVPTLSKDSTDTSYDNVSAKQVGEEQRLMQLTMERESKVVMAKSLTIFLF